MENTLARIDLNLLKALHALLEEGSVTRAAARLFITQSAMSKALTRLRALFDDPLFVRTPQGLRPTARALQLAPALRQAFVQVESCLQPAQFNPAQAGGRVRIAAPEQFALIIVPRLIARLRASAPGLMVETQHLMDDHLAQLASGALDFVVNLDQAYPRGFSARRIYSAIPLLWCRREHPLARKKRVGLADMCAYPQITFRAQNMTSADMRMVENTFARAALMPEAILDTSHLLIALDVLGKTDALMMAPDYLSGLSILKGEIVPMSIAQIPEFDRLRINISLVRHELTNGSPLHRWLADEIAALGGLPGAVSSSAASAASAARRGRQRGAS